MPLQSAKFIHKATNTLCNIGSQTKDDIRRYCRIAGLLESQFDFDGNRWSVWNRILTTLNQDNYPDRFNALLNAVIDDPNIAENERVFVAELVEQINSARNSVINELAKALLRRECVLFLGAEIFRVRTMEGASVPFNANFCNIVTNQLDIQSIYYDSAFKGNLNYVSQCFFERKGYVSDLAANEYNKLMQQNRIDDSLYQKIAQLPFEVIVNTNPDKLLLSYLPKPLLWGYDFFDVSNNKAAINFDESRSLNSDYILYNIFGGFDSRFSILYSESQFLNLVNCMVDGNPRINPNVSNKMYEKRTYFFLGFNFEEWYLKVLLECLQVKKIVQKAISCNSLGFNNANQEYYEDEYQMYFHAGDISTFLTDLRLKYESLVI